MVSATHFCWKLELGFKLIYFKKKRCSGGSLESDIHQNGAYCERRSQSLAYQVVDAIEYLHRQQIYHRDLNPRNLVFSTKRKDHLKVIDFGFSTDNDEFECERVGCFEYMAPEVINRESGKCKAIDIWGIGCMIYFMLFGRSPFERGECGETVMAISFINFSCKIKGFQISPEAETFISRCLCRVSNRATIHDLIQHPWLLSQSSAT